MKAENSDLKEFGKFRLDARRKILRFEGKTVPMPLKELELLSILVENKGELVTKEEILDKIWADSFVEESNLSRHIYLLRKTLKDFGAEGELIENVPRRGYRFTGEVREIRNGELIIEKHTRTQTLIEIQEDEIQRSDAKARKSVLSKFFASPLILFFFSLAFIGAIAFFGYRGWQAKTSASEIKSIAVLPFRTIEAESENIRQGLGLADILITRLSHIKEISVRPTSAIMNFENQDSISAGRKLNVDAVLEGAIYRVSDKMRVTARLIKVGDGALVWSGQFERLATDELSLQNEIALQVADALALNLSSGEKDALTNRYTENPDAFRLYQKGRYEWNKRSWAGAIEAERLFRNAIEKDPNFVLAYVGLADTMAMDIARSEETFGLIQKALERDPNLAPAYATLGFLKMFHRWQWQEAESAFKKSVELNPNYGSAHHWYAELLTIEGRHEEAKAEMRRALEINPLSHNFLADLGQIYYFNREYNEAEKYCRKALEIYPDFQFAHEYLYQIYLKTGDYDNAVEELLAAEKIQTSFANQSAERQKELEANLNNQRKIYREGGIKKFEENRIRATEDGNICYLFARNYAFIGEHEKALICLEKAFESRGFLSVFVKADSIFDDLRQEPRYQAILQKMNLE